MGGFTDYERYDAVGLAELVRQKEVSPSELLDAAIDRVEKRDGQINAVVMQLYDYARKSIMEGLPDGPLRGVPFLLKDISGWLAGERVTRGSRFFADAPPAAVDNEHVGRLKSAGLVIFGRTNACELGLSLTCEPTLYGATKNPWDVTRTPGGSSGGAAAAVAARILPMAHATDGFGSIRAPAACCGVVGLKPTRARNTLAPYAGEGFGGIVAEHAVTLTVRDSAALLDATCGPGPGDPYVAPKPERPFLEDVGRVSRKLRIAFTSVAPDGVAVDAHNVAALADIARLCADLGHDVEDVSPEIDSVIDAAAIVPTFLTLASANTVVSLSSHPTKGRSPQLGEVETVTYAMGELGQTVSAADYVRATQTAHRLGRQMAAFHETYDVLLTPALATLPPKLGWIDMMMEDFDEYWRRVFHFSPFTVWFNLTGQPAMVLPLVHCNPTAGRPESIPVSVQIVGRYGDEATLFQLAGQLEAARPWFDRTPPILG